MLGRGGGIETEKGKVRVQRAKRDNGEREKLSEKEEL